MAFLLYIIFWHTPVASYVYWKTVFILINTSSISKGKEKKTIKKGSSDSKVERPLMEVDFKWRGYELKALNSLNNDNI